MRDAGPDLTRPNAVFTRFWGKNLKMESRYAHLDALENQSIYILREAYRKFKRLAMLWSIGKDSCVMLWLLRKAFFGHVPIPCVHVDTELQNPGDDRVSRSSGEGMGNQS